LPAGPYRLSHGVQGIFITSDEVSPGTAFHLRQMQGGRSHILGMDKMGTFITFEK
jgi:hypothetical protein